MDLYFWASLSSKEIRAKIEQTNVKKYGGKTPGCSDIVKEKIKKTNQDRYGGNSPKCSTEIKLKEVKHNFEKYRSKI